ncbi:MAG: hypothetical protein QNI99_08540 [Woeseiaceae bacterium]|nr:hypothetical protein [Woeseiaceae bacterium]
MSDHETDIHDLSLGVIHALRMIDPRAMSYAQLRRLYAALVKTTAEVEREIGERSGQYKKIEASQPPISEDEG